MSDCQVPGWGTGPWGIMPWGGQSSESGGALPTTEAFGIYCFGPCGPMAGILGHPEVSVVETGPQFSIDGPTLDLVIQSGAGESSNNAALTISVPVPEKFTFETTALFQSLPPNFGALTSSHVFLGVFDASGAAVGLFFSRVGIAYSGAIHFDGGNLVLDGPLELLPGSALFVSEGEYLTLRLACDGVAGVVYIYVTRTSQLGSIGHQLRFILPTLLSSTMAIVPADETAISVRGTDAAPSRVLIDNICLGQGLLIPNIVPFADAGVDQAIQRCSVAELDGGRSFDPEGAPLAYSWRLIDAPLSSQYLFHGLDAATYPQEDPTGFTDRVYSSSLEALNDVDPLTSGDVLVVAGGVHVLSSVGTDGSGFYVRVEGYIVPDSLTGAGFKYLRQHGISGRLAVKPTFYPDAAGLYRFDLVVFDGSLFSEPSTTVLNVTESPVARGITPDLRFIWNYLSDFWRLVEDTERIEAFWSGLAQVAAAELLNLWQVDYSKSLRDVQRTAQRRWLHYDFLMQEGLPELTTFRVIYSGIESVDIPPGGLAGVAGSQVVFAIPPLSAPVVVQFSGAGDLSAAVMQAALQAALFSIDARFKVVILVKRSGVSRLRIDAPFALAVADTTTATLFLPGTANALPKGQGTSIAPRSYKVDRSLEGVGLREGDLLMLGGVGYPVGRLIDDPGDEWPWQRVTLLDAIALPAPSTWSFAGQAFSKTLDFDAGLVTAGDVVTVEIITLGTGESVSGNLIALGSSPSSPRTLAVDLTPIGSYLGAPLVYSVFLTAVLRRTFLPLDPLVVDLPYLQEKIRSTDDTEVLRRNVDYFFTTRAGQSCLRFVTGAAPEPDVWQYGSPPIRMWAEVTYLDNRETIEANFGVPAGFTLDDLDAFPSNVDYLSSVRGLWYAYFNGPTLYNLKAGTQILLGLPFAEEVGTIEEIRTDFSSTQGRLLVRDAVTTAIVRSYTYPSKLLLETNPRTGQPYQVGDQVAQFAPLVTGVEVTDWVKDPRWFAGYLGQGVFFEVEKFFKFLVRVDSTAFNLAAVLFVRSFILRIKPTYTSPVFAVLANIGDTEISVTDTVRHTGRLILNDLGVTSRSFGMSTMLDEPDASGGGWQSQLDTDSDPSTAPPTYPTADLVLWGLDKNYLAPEDAIVAALTMEMPHLAPPDFTGGAPDSLPFLDAIFRLDLPVYDTGDGLGTLHFHDNHVHGVPKGPGGYVMELDAQIAANAGTYTLCQLDITGDAGDTPSDFYLVIEKNGAAVVTQGFVAEVWGKVLGLVVAVDVLVGDILRARLRPIEAVDARPNWHQVTVQLFRGVSWALDAPMAAGTYGSLRAM